MLPPRPYLWPRAPDRTVRRRAADNRAALRQPKAVRGEFAGHRWADGSEVGSEITDLRKGIVWPGLLPTTSKRGPCRLGGQSNPWGTGLPGTA